MKMTKALALRCNVAFAILVVIILLISTYLEFHEEVLKSQKMQQNVSQEVLFQLNERIERIITKEKIAASLIATRVSEAEPEELTKETLLDWVEYIDSHYMSLFQGKVAAIYDQNQNVLYRAGPGLEHLDDPKGFHQLKNEGFSWALLHNPDTDKLSIFTSIMVNQQRVKKAHVVLMFNRSIIEEPLILDGVHAYFTNEYNIAFQLGQRELTPFQLLLPDVVPLTQEHQQLAYRELGIAKPKSMIKVTRHDDVFGNFSQLSHLPDQLFYQLPKAFERDNWSLSLFISADQSIESIEDDLLESALWFFGLICVFFVSDQFIRFHFKIKILTVTDPLTRLFNRQHLIDNQANMTALQDRGTFKHLGVIAIDIDHFKKVNDTYGHGVGDISLKVIAKIMKTECRDSDWLYRFGGEEFIIICPGADLGALKILSERLRTKVEGNQEILKHLPIGFTISIGCTLRHEKEDMEAVLTRVDSLLYQAKNNGRNRVEFELN